MLFPTTAASLPAILCISRFFSVVVDWWGLVLYLVSGLTLQEMLFPFGLAFVLYVFPSALYWVPAGRGPVWVPF